MAETQGKGVLILIGTPVALVAALFALVIFFSNDSASAACSGRAGSADPDTVPTDPVAGYSGEQLKNAALIMNAANPLGLDRAAQVIGVMTAMGESGLRVIGHGDTAGPDSRGLFQQRANGLWGSESDRMDAHISAANFFPSPADDRRLGKRRSAGPFQSPVVTSPFSCLRRGCF